jgi:hypothetical protein
MFDVMAETEAAMRLHIVAGSLFVTSGSSLARWTGSGPEPLPSELVRLSASGSEIGRRKPSEICGVFGRFPDRAWLAASFGWHWSGEPGRPGAPVPEMACGRWDGSRWVERADVPSLTAWTDACLVDSLFETRWADPDDRPVPLGLLRAAGEHGFSRSFDGQAYEWSHHPAGQGSGRRLDAPFATREHVVFAVGRHWAYAAGLSGQVPFASYCQHSAPSEQSTSSYRSRADVELVGWHDLAPPPGLPTALAIGADEALWLLASNLVGPPEPSGSRASALFRLVALRWEPVFLPHSAYAQQIANADGALWAVARADEQERWSLLREQWAAPRT